ncbi:CoA-substrate-specific enzyme activase [Thermotomaculum hydrothermale]|uniref:CoA-substrate-specific enzyme activase n=1 Tax=Thermotomaculum hydrothermale TaxID=981385 RepID=A0A7R6PZ35_9BACT|nr:acyl-CoA dehydratase activase [Thermotomaculum hydrothermale]BBB33545.1 CoA-substrate-specific enzyme activase [Thermotomaculum hydrothermale]
MDKAIGIDVGSTTVKLVVINEQKIIINKHIENTKPRIKEQVKKLIEKVKSDLKEENIPIISTGYGRKLVEDAKENLTEITCHAKGIYNALGFGGTLVDIGGQDSKVIVIDKKGRVLDFTMNDKCSAGTGRFLEHTAGKMEISVEEIGKIALNAKKELKISSTCTVFAESEIISLLAYGEEIDAILKGLHRSLVTRIVGMINSVAFTPPIMLSGGVAKNEAIKKMLEEETGYKIFLPKYPQLMGAYGAAIIAFEKYIKNSRGI